MTKHWMRTAIAALVLSVCTTAAFAQQQTTQQGAAAPKPAPKTTDVPTPASPLNLNTATAADLEKLPGIGPAVAARIIEQRQKLGGFKKIEDLMTIRGIGEKTFLKLKPLIVIAPVKATER